MTIPHGAVTVRDWQSDLAHASKRPIATGYGQFACPTGLTVHPDRGRSIAQAVGLILACQQARATEPE